jgi:hypothetical protein
VRFAVVTAALIAGLAGAPSALADTNTSANWAGFAVHKPGVNFHKVRSAPKSTAA